MPITPLHLRPKAPYKFLPSPEKIDGTWHWEGLRISQSEEMGNYLQFFNPRKGLLVPYGSDVITPQRYNTMLKNPGRYINDYLLFCGEGPPRDGNPILAEKHCWPASFLNEAAEGTDAKYNCQIVLLKSSDFPLMPDYPNFPKGDHMPFVEFMVDTPRNLKDEWQTGWLVYSSERSTRKPSRRGYTPKASSPENCGPGWKSHWTINYWIHESKVLNDRLHSDADRAAAEARAAITSRKRPKTRPPNNTGKHYHMSQRPRRKLTRRTYEG